MVEIPVILIGGISHTGKTSLAESMAKRLEWTYLYYGQPRTPSRPPVENPVRPFVPEDVSDRYLSLTVDELITDVFRYYRGMWPGIKSLITEHASNRATDPLNLESSALWP